MPNLTRKQFLIGSLGLATAGLIGRFTGWETAGKQITGRIVGASSAIGHKLRQGNFPEITTTIRKKVVIVGGGIAGLSAAWKLYRSGFTDFILLELEKEVGGNASSGENAVSAYPWGAHYVPLLTKESTEAHSLFEELGIITGYQNGLPVYNDYYISADPHERLFIHGRWQEGLVPQVSIGSTDKQQYHDFFAKMDSFKDKRGADGKPLFAIPVDRSSGDADTRALDTVSMADYMQQHGWDSPYLKWYVDYCCRDDYGAIAADVSAWAGIHYFAARNGHAANTDAQSVLTWPEGNGWIVKQLKKQLSNYIKPDHLAFRAEKTANGATISCWNATDNSCSRIEADAVIFATPRFVSERLLKTETDLSKFHYSPWMVANITLDKLPEDKGAPLSWDNMVYDSQMLGYVTATNQSLTRAPLKTVLTYYWPLSHLSPGDARKEMIGRTYETWRDMVMQELLQIHPDLKNHITNLDIWLWGHGMIRPSPGFIWGEARRATLEQAPPFFYAHSDMSGISIFEEANYHGVQAALALMKELNHTPVEHS